jgi:secondary thiamine-phosphate synthase enzyme
MINDHSVLELKTEARQQFIDVTDWVEETVRQVGLGQGIATVFTQHTSCCVLIQEESEDVTYWNVQYILQDTLNALQKIAPPARHEGQYLHPGPVHIRNAAELRGEEPAWGLNTDGHIIGSLLGRVQVVPVTDSATLGEFGAFYFGDRFDSPERARVRVHLLGEDDTARAGGAKLNQAARMLTTQSIWERRISGRAL